MYKIDKSLGKLTKEQRDSIQFNKIRNEKEGITTQTEELKKNHQILLKGTYSRKLEKSRLNE